MVHIESYLIKILYKFPFFRYMAIITPLKKRLGQRCTLIVILWTWILGVLVGLPNVLFFRTEQLQNSTRISCYMLWPDGDTNASSLEYQ